MYEIGRVHVWQNCTGGKAFLNGQETTVTSGMVDFFVSSHNVMIRAQWTDTVGTDGLLVGALPGQLRPKNPPTGEQKIRSMFEPKPVMEVA